MHSKLLLPHRFKLIGFLLFIPSVLLGILFRYNDYVLPFLITRDADIKHFAPEQNLTDELALTGIIISLLMIAFAREKEEDEFIHQTRLQSWEWAVLINFILLLIATWVFYDEAFIDVMMYNMLTPLIIFILRFNWILWRNKISGEKKDNYAKHH